MRTIDLNCDLGEGTGADERLMPLVSSANVACGGHAGDDATMRTAVALAWKEGVGVGAHPGYADREGFGRREMGLTPDAIRSLVIEQVTRLADVAHGARTRLRHVKPHGALYNRACADADAARAVADAVRAVGPNLALIGLPGSAVERAADDAGLRFVGEFFADRTYQADGTLTPRSLGDAASLVHDPAEALARVLRVLDEGVVLSTDGVRVPVRAETVCVHGDGATAVDLLHFLRRGLEGAGVGVRAFAVAGGVG